MDHAINNLRSYMQSSIDMYSDIGLKKDDIKEEIKAYTDAMNKLEAYYYGKKQTSLDVVLSSYKERSERL